MVPCVQFTELTSKLKLPIGRQERAKILLRGSVGVTVAWLLVCDRCYLPQHRGCASTAVHLRFQITQVASVLVAPIWL